MLRPLPKKNRIAFTIPATAGALVLAVSMIGCASVSANKPHADSSTARAQIELRLNEIFDAVAKKDFNRLDSYHAYGPKFTKFSASSPGRLNAEASRQGEHDGLAALTDLKMRADDLKIDVFGRVGIATFILDSSFKSGINVVVKKDQSTLVFIKDGGAWKITHEHFSPIRTTP